MSALFIILVDVTMTLFRNKMLITYMQTWFDAQLNQKILNGIYYTAQKKRIELETENWWTEVFFGVALVSKLSFLKVIWLKMYEKKN